MDAKFNNFGNVDDGMGKEEVKQLFNRQSIIFHGKILKYSHILLLQALGEILPQKLLIFQI